jgi:four helix bundle protein
MGSRNYQDLIVWQWAMDLAELVYPLARKFLRDEIYALTSQARRAAVSVPANIAEGEDRNANREIVLFLRIAHGSLRELETHQMRANRFGYIEKPELEHALAAASEVGRLINGLIRSKTNADPP